jgi:hypothetical protein
MSLYTVSSIELAPLAGFHDGTGTFHDSKWVVAPESVPGSGKLQFRGHDSTVTTMLFQLDANVVPNWFAVGVSGELTDFTHPHIFFHPMPAQAGYLDADYPTKTGKWPQLFYYAEVLGYELVGSSRSQVLIMPFLTQAAANTGIFAANWHDIVRDILVLVRSKLGKDDGSALEIAELAMSSFSVGIVYMMQFRNLAPDLDAHLTEIWDFDGRLSSASNLSTSLVSTPQVRAIKYDQVNASDASAFHLPMTRWSDYVNPPTTVTEVHHYIRDFMFFHGASISNVGGLIGAAGTGTPPPPAPAPPVAPPPVGAPPPVAPPPVVTPPPVETPPVAPPPLTPPPVVPPSAVPPPVPTPPVVPMPVPPPPVAPAPVPTPAPVPMPVAPPEQVPLVSVPLAGAAVGCSNCGTEAQLALVSTTAITAITAIAAQG